MYRLYKYLFFMLLAPALIYAQTFRSGYSQLSKSELNKFSPRLQKILASEYKGTGYINLNAKNFIQTTASNQKIVQVVVYTDNSQPLVNSGIQVNSVLPQFCTVRASMTDILRLAGMRGVKYIEFPEINYPLNDVAVGITGADILHNAGLNNTIYKGRDVIVGVIDTGIDWTHKDFCDPDDNTKSRILYLWDQTLNPQGGETFPSENGLHYGVEYTKAHLDDELDSSPAGFVRERDINGHGTHVAGTAAGNGASLPFAKYTGMAPEADIIIVKAGDGSFTSNNIINGLNYIRAKAEAMGKPVVVNMSLGSDAGPHDGTDNKSQAIDNFSGAGRIVVVAAGNSGNSSLHINGVIEHGHATDIEVTVPAFTAAAGSDNDDIWFTIWFNNNNDISAEIITPNNNIVPCGPDDWVMTDLSDGSVYIENKTNYINFQRYIEGSFYDGIAAVPPDNGTWTVRLTNNSGASMNYHGWFYDRSIGSPAETVTISSGNTGYTLGNSANKAVIVGSFVHRWYWSDYNSLLWYGGTPNLSDNISSFSSFGPTRDGRQKPDIAAPGDKMASSLSKDASANSSRILPGQKHQLIQGTSMASPVVAGCTALLLEINPSLTSDQITSLINDHSDKDVYTSSAWHTQWGNGKLNVLQAAGAASGYSPVVEREILVYDQWSTSNVVTLGSSGMNKIGLRFTPDLKGIVTGVFIQTETINSLTASLDIEIWTDNVGVPGAKLPGSNTVSIDPECLLIYSSNFVNLVSANAIVLPGENYHLVISPGNTGEQLEICTDNTSSQDRTSANNGSIWFSVSNNIRIRPVIMSTGGVQLSLKVFLEGPYNTNTGEMNTGLQVPLTSPYGEDGRTLSAMPANIADWVLLQLRLTPNGPSVCTKSVLLRKDGYIVNDDGSENFIELDVIGGDYYLVVRHRNHLAVMSGTACSLNSLAPTLCDLTSGDGTQIYGLASSKKLSDTNVWGMMGGDANNSGFVDETDKLITWSNRTISGYLTLDCDMNGFVGASDRNLVWNNRNKSTRVP